MKRINNQNVWKQVPLELDQVIACAPKLNGLYWLRFLATFMLIKTTCWELRFQDKIRFYGAQMVLRRY